MSEAGPGTVSMPFRHRNSPARHTVQDTPSPCTPRGEGEGSPSAAAQLSPLSAFGLRSRNGIETVPHGTPCRSHHPPAPPQAGPASLCSPCRTGILLPIFVRRRSPSQAAQVLQPGGAGPFSQGTPAPPIQHPRFPAAQVLQEKTDLRQNAPGLAPGCPRTCAGMPQDLRRPIGGPAPYYCLPCGDGTLAPLWLPSRRGRRRNEPSSLP